MFASVVLGLRKVFSSLGVYAMGEPKRHVPVRIDNRALVLSPLPVVRWEHRNKGGCSMSRSLRQAWWGPLVGLLVVGELVIAAAFVFAGDSVEDSIAGAAVALGGALLLVAGLWQRPHARALGSTLLIIGCGAAAIWFWSLVMPLVAIVVVVSVVISWLRPRPMSASLQ
jgi:hypothetical protein